MFTPWDGSLVLNHEIIDADHRSLSDAIGRVADAVSAPCAAGEEAAWQANVQLALTDLGKRCEAHFDSEEWIMDSSGYPEIDAHRSQHRMLLDEFAAFAGGPLTPDPETYIYATRFLRDWFEFHIQTWDTALVRWLDGLDPERPGDAD